MPKQNRKPGIHLHKTDPVLSERRSKYGVTYGPPVKPEYYWILIAKNGKTIARSSKMYKRKGSAVRSIVVAADIISGLPPVEYYDHTGKNGVEVVEF